RAAVAQRAPTHRVAQMYTAIARETDHTRDGALLVDVRRVPRDRRDVGFAAAAVVTQEHAVTLCPRHPFLGVASIAFSLLGACAFGRRADLGHTCTLLRRQAEVGIDADRNDTTHEHERREPEDEQGKTRAPRRRRRRCLGTWQVALAADAVVR